MQYNTVSVVRLKILREKRNHGGFENRILGKEREKTTEKTAHARKEIQRSSSAPPVRRMNFVLLFCHAPAARVYARTRVSVCTGWSR